MPVGRHRMSADSLKKLFMTADKFLSDLLALAKLPDDEIDTSDISETLDFSGAKIGRFSDITFRGYDVRSIANWCVAKAKKNSINLSNLSVNKLVFFIYERALKELNVLLTPARVEAWDYGPVFRELYFNFPSGKAEFFEKYNVQKRSKELVQESFETEDLELFERVWNDFGHLSASQLTRISHQPSGPWSAVWNGGGDVNPGMIIDINLILGRNVDQPDGSD